MAAMFPESNKEPLVVCMPGEHHYIPIIEAGRRVGIVCTLCERIIDEKVYGGNMEVSDDGTLIDTPVWYHHSKGGRL